jgi:tryptophan synthase alpha chain
MSRIEAVFAALRNAGRKGLVPYITAGDPGPEWTAGLMHALAQGGADVIELGIPFSDPMADGPVIQLACERALARHTSLWKVLDIVAEFRRGNTSTPVVLMGYLNPIETRGVEHFAQRAKEAGVDGVLVVDLAIEEAAETAPILRAAGLDTVFLLAPTSSEERIAAIAREARGYLYYVSLKGVTGAATLDVSSVQRKLAEVRRHTGLPVAVGFGIRDAESAAQVGRVADAIVVGSALVAQIERNAGNPQALPGILREQVQTLRAALDGLAAEQ